MKSLPMCMWVVCLMALGCAPSAVDVGAALVANPRLSDSNFNAVACTTCHRDADDDNAPRIASSFDGMARRPTYWNGEVERLIDAVNFCATRFMRSSDVDSTDPKWRAVYEYLLSRSPATLPSTPVDATFVENVTTINTGSARAGEAVWNTTCAGCHGDKVTGRGRLDESMSLVPQASIEYGEENGFPPSLVLIEKVRHGGFFGVGGVMPPFSVEALSDEDLGALLSYLEL
jgi:thiosulfate dehydrogenase